MEYPKKAGDTSFEGSVVPDQVKMLIRKGLRKPHPNIVIVESPDFDLVSGSDRVEGSLDSTMIGGYRSSFAALEYEITWAFAKFVGQLDPDDTLVLYRFLEPRPNYRPELEDFVVEIYAEIAIYEGENLEVVERKAKD